MTQRLRLVLYAEGAGETGLFAPYAAPAGGPLEPNCLGPAHDLVRRVIEASVEASVTFETPLRSMNRVPRGSDLLNKKVLPILVTWLESAKRPDLAVILVDDDGVADRRRDMLDALQARPSSAPLIVIGVSILEFESWLIADIAAVNTTLSSKHSQTPAPESLKPGQAKQTLTRWIAEAGRTDSTHEVRRSICSSLDLDRVSSLCSSFRAFRADLRSECSKLVGKV